jgi:signal transduction histidine kinase
MKTRSKIEHARQRLELISNKPVEKEEVVTSAVEYLNEQLDYIADALPLKDRKKLQKDFSEVAKTIISANQSSREEMHHLRLIASSSTLLPVFAHEVKSFVGGLEVDCGRLELLEKELPERKAKLVRGIRKGMEKSQKRFIDLLELTSLMGMESKNEIPQRLAIKDRVEIATKCFQLITNKTGITIDDSKIPNDLMVGPLQEAELYAILLNSLSNSIKAVIASDGEKKIGLKAQKKGGKVKINIMDTGIGIATENFEDVFMPFVADPQNKLYKRLKRNINPEDMVIVGTGSGLGLSIVRDIVSARNGSIKFVEPTENWKTNLEIELP